MSRAFDARRWNSLFNVRENQRETTLKLVNVREKQLCFNKDDGMATTQSNITSFSGANSATVTVDGLNALVENANQSYSLTEPDSNTLRFEVRPGDHFIDSDLERRDDGRRGRTF